MNANTEPKAAPGIVGRKLKYNSMDRFKIKMDELRIRLDPLMAKRDKIDARISALQDQGNKIQDRIHEITGEMAETRGHMDMANWGAKFYKIEDRARLDDDGILLEKWSVIKFFDDAGNEIDLAPKPLNQD
ncbi:MAG: hypothetical protein MUO84_07110 [Thermoplasmata archaeon]|nr:hypothetical protein [Thermoplasmata archaeon]